MIALSLEQLLTLTRGRIGRHDVPCPLCSHIYNPKRQVLRIWIDRSDFAGWHCARCGEKGFARQDSNVPPVVPERLEQLRREAEERDEAETARQLCKAAWFWRCSVPAEKTVKTYLRHARGYSRPIPPTIRYLKPLKPEHHPALIAVFGLCDEPEPGVLEVRPGTVAGVYLILLKPDGSSKAGTDRDKFSIGRGSKGLPIVLAPPNDLLGLVIAEGLEDGLSAHEATGLGAWAAGGSHRLPALAAAVPDWIDCVTVVQDADPAGREGSNELARRLQARSIHVELHTLASGSPTRESAA
jgi:hypothetical protein